MDNSFSVSAFRYHLPPSHQVSIPTLLRIFSSTATSYKYLFFIGLLQVLEDTNFSTLHIPLDAILLEMLVTAWYPHSYFRLSFGINDRIAEELDRLSVETPRGFISHTELRARIETCDYRKNNLIHLVPYRLLTPFFPHKLQGRKDAQKNRDITELAARCFETIRPFYCFSEDQDSVIMHPAWMLYFSDNLELVRSFIHWQWLDYMQRRNPSVPNLQLKLFPPKTKKPLKKQTDFWRTVLAENPLPCIFSGQLMTAEDFSLDHFLPWSFVAHDQLWNLTPVPRSVNSAKFNHLPSLDVYFNKFASIQYTALKTYKLLPGTPSFETVVRPYIADLHLTPDDLLDRTIFHTALKRVITPLYALAASQGFASDWVFNASS
jgi:hypothetical protein